MAENLRVRNFNNGTPLTAYVYNNNSAYEATYGLLYTWYTMTSDNGIAPDGWRTFSYDDFYTLYEYLTPDAGRKLKANVLWGILGANNDDVTGFQGIAGRV